MTGTDPERIAIARQTLDAMGVSVDDLLAAATGADRPAWRTRRP